MFPSRLLICRISQDGNPSSKTGPASKQHANYLLKAQLTMLMVMLMLVCFPACLFLMIVTKAVHLSPVHNWQKEREKPVGLVIPIRSLFCTTDILIGIKSPLPKVSREDCTRISLYYKSAMHWYHLFIFFPPDTDIEMCNLLSTDQSETS